MWLRCSILNLKCEVKSQDPQDPEMWDVMWRWLNAQAKKNNHLGQKVTKSYTIERISLSMVFIYRVFYIQLCEYMIYIVIHRIVKQRTYHDYQTRHWSEYTSKIS